MTLRRRASRHSEPGNFGKSRKAEHTGRGDEQQGGRGPEQLHEIGQNEGRNGAKEQPDRRHPAEPRCIAGGTEQRERQSSLNDAPQA